MNRTEKHFRHHTGGVAAVEFALVLPVLMTLFYGVVEITRYILVTQKVEKLAYTVGDSISNSTTVTNAEMDQLLTATNDIMKPFSFTSNGTVMISSLYKAAGANPVVNWRHQGGGTLTATSALGAVGAAPQMPAGFTFDDRENVIAAEVFYRFSPLISSRFFGTTTIYRRVFYSPRFGSLTATPV